MEVRATSFRIGALAIGVIGVITTALVVSFSFSAIICGILFGAGGWLVDYFTRFRKLGGQLSSWALVAGGLIVLLVMRDGIANQMGFNVYAIPLQYFFVVLICWGVLMFVMPTRNHEP